MLAGLRRSLASIHREREKGNAGQSGRAQGLKQDLIWGNIRRAESGQSSRLGNRCVDWSHLDAGVHISYRRYHS